MPRPQDSPTSADAATAPDERALALSAMGRPITVQVVEKPDASSQILAIAGHRASAPIDPIVIDRLVRRAASDTETVVSVTAIRDCNPDGAITQDRRTVLGVDLEADHLQRLAGETAVLHQAIDRWPPAVILDLGERATAQRTSADIEVVLRYDRTGGASAPEWLAQLGSEMRRRLKSSRFSVDVSLAAADTSSVTVLTGIPVVEVTAVSPPHAVASDRTLEGVIEAAAAAYGAAGLLRKAASI